jgi:DNA-binding cell septation regulator SpoVG
MGTMPLKSRIEVTNLDFIGQGNLKALADVKIGRSLRIYGFRIIQQPHQRAWVSPPQHTYQGKDGTVRYSPMCELSGTLKSAVDECILQAWAEGVKPV